MLILKQNAANSVPTPPVGKDTFFIDDSGVPSIKNAAGNITTFPTVAASNSQVVFMNGTSLSGEAALTYDFNNNVLNVTGNISATNVKTDNLLYANGLPWDLQDPGGSNTQIQFNDDESFGGSAALTFNKTTNAVSMTGNLTAGNINGGNLVSANYIGGTLTTASNAQPNITSVGTLVSLDVSGTVTAGNVYSNTGVIGANILAGTLSTNAQPNITSVGSLTTLSVTGNANVGNIGATAGIFSTISGDLTTAAQPNITSVGTLTGLGVNGNLTAANISANTGAFYGNAAGLTNIPGGNITGNITGNISNANYAAFAGEVVDASQPNITSVGTLTSLDVTGNTVAGNFNTAGKVVASSFESNVANGTAPLVVVSTTKVANLNADLLDGYSTASAATANTVVIRDADGSFSANVITANLSGNATTAGTVVTAAQPNITSVGTLSSLTITGNASAGNISTGGDLSVTGNASAGNINAGNLLTANFVAGTLTTAAQPNITSVGSLTGLTVSGHIIPSANVTYDLGNATNAFRDLYLDGNSIKLGGASIKANATSIILQNPLGGQVVVSGNSVASSSEIINGTSNVNIPSANSNVNISANGTANVLVVTGTGTNVTGTFNASGNANVGNIGATNGVFTNVSGNGSSLSSITGANVTGQVSFAATANAVAGANVSGQVGNALVAGTVYTNAQPNITSVGTLSSLAVTGNATAGNVSATGDVSGATLTGSLTTATQSNITSVGTLTGLGVNGNITAANITANTGVFTGNAAGLTNIPSGNINGQVANALVAGTVYTNAQPNITSVGTLSSLTVTGNATAGNVYANSGTIGAANLTGTLTTAAQPNITSVGTLSSLSVTGNVAAGNLTTVGILSVTGTGTSSIAGNLDMTSNNITNLAEPVNASDAATKAYVDSVAEGLHTHDSCNAATQTTLATISGGTVTYNNGTSGVGATLTTTGSYTTIDGVTLSDGMRILVKSEANAAHNGIYTRTSSTVLTRATDFDSAAEMAGGDFTFITAGTLYDNTGWVMTDAVTTVGTDPVNWTQFSGSGTYTAGTGLTLTGTQFSVNTAQPTITSVGTLSSLGVSGNITAANITANTGIFSGNGSGLTALAGANVTGQVGNALVAGTVYTAAQPNITSVGTLTGLTLAANADITLSGTGSEISGANLISATNLTGTLTTASQPNITSVGTLTSLGVNGTVTAVAFTANTGVFTGNGSGLTALAGGNVTGQVANALVAGTVYTAAQPNITSVGTLSSLAVTGNATAGNVYANSGTIGASLLAGTLTTAAQPNVTSVGTLTSLGVSGNITAANITANTGVFTGNGSGLSAVNASNISSGTLAQARLANATLTLGSTTLTLGATTTTVAGLTSVTSTTFVGALTGAATTAGTVTTAAQPNITSVSTSFTSLTFANAQTITGNNITFSTGANTNAGTFTGNFSLSTGSRLNATYADLAEKYVADADYEPGTVLLFGGDHEVTVSNELDSHRVAGVVSTNPAYTMNNECVGEHVAMVALTGRVPVKVHGPVAKGDLMVSGPNGHAVANNMARAGTIIGKALQNFSGDHGVIEVVVGRV